MGHGVVVVWTLLNVKLPGVEDRDADAFLEIIGNASLEECYFLDFKENPSSAHVHLAQYPNFSLEPQRWHAVMR